MERLIESVDKFANQPEFIQDIVVAFGGAVVLATAAIIYANRKIKQIMAPNSTKNMHSGLPGDH
jgi:hypothetical protein